MPSVNLPRAYRPDALSDVSGQREAIDALRSWVRHADGTPAAFIFHGPSGVGKTAAAWALAFDLGCDREQPEFGGVTEIATGQQDGKAVEHVLQSLWLRPMFGSGWRVVIVNEADYMTTQAEAIWLDGLERLPHKSVIVFTTNEITALSDRFVSRCECQRFVGDGPKFKRAVAQLARRVWKSETGKALPHVPENLGVFDQFGRTLSMRLALQQLGPYIRTGEPLPAAFTVPLMRPTETAAQKAWATRRQKGELANVR